MKKVKKAIGLLLCFSICFTSTVFAAQDSQNIPLSTDEKITQNELSPSNEVTDSNFPYPKWDSYLEKSIL